MATSMKHCAYSYSCKQKKQIQQPKMKIVKGKQGNYTELWYKQTAKGS